MFDWGLKHSHSWKKNLLLLPWILKLIVYMVNDSTPLLFREDGWFDFLVNGGGSITLQFGKSPFPPQTQTLFAPWNEVIIISFKYTTINVGFKIYLPVQIYKFYIVIAKGGGGEYSDLLVYWGIWSTF